MNPFDLTGPVFLLFYAVMTGCLLWMVRHFRDTSEDSPPPKVSELGPYALAYLRAGPRELLCVAAVSLLDRGLLIAQGSALVAKPGALGSVRRPFERALLSYFSTPKEANNLLIDPAIEIHTASTESDLIRDGLALNAEQRAQRFFRAGLACLIIAGFGRVGDRALLDAQTLCAGLRERGQSLVLGEGSFELSLLIGAFGLSALGSAARVALQPLFPRAFAPAPGAKGSRSGDSSCSTTCGSSSGSSCGTSAGSSCGSSCGGCGGCGGGD